MNFTFNETIGLCEKVNITVDRFVNFGKRYNDSSFNI